jgi:[acyl-carrier-protein] S-malonyltransferase
MTDAIIFPGQGAQHEGMGKAWADESKAAAKVFEDADSILGFSLSDACWSSGDDIHRTDLAQPAIFTSSAAALAGLKERGFDLSGVKTTAGLSLGEYSALWWAGVLSFEDALRLVRLRGQAMQEASELSKSGMMSLVGATREQAKAIADAGAEAGICSVANMNAPGQIVISGEIAALDKAEEAAKDSGVRRAIRLSVAGGFHSECMRPAADKLGAALSETHLNEPKATVISNVTARPVSGPEEVRDLLQRQVCSPVLWEESVRWMIDSGCSTFLEPAPGKVLTGIMRKINRDIPCESADIPTAEEGAETA